MPTHRVSTMTQSHGPIMGESFTDRLFSLKVYKRMRYLECPDLMFGDEIEYGIFKVRGINK